MGWGGGRKREEVMRGEERKKKFTGRRKCERSRGRSKEATVGGMG